MDRLKRMHRLSLAISIGVGVVIGQKASVWVEQYYKSVWLSPLVALIIFAICFQFLTYLLENLFDGSKRLRKILLGRQFVEGTWLDLMSKEAKPFSYGISYIKSFELSSLRISGEDFDLEGNNCGHYYSDLIKVEWPTIKYTYTYQHSSNPQLSCQGLGELQFIEREGPPNRYRGSFFDILEGKRNTFEGWKVKDSKLLNQLDNPNTQKEAILNFFKVDRPF